MSYTETRHVSAPYAFAHIASNGRKSRFCGLSLTFPPQCVCFQKRCRLACDLANSTFEICWFSQIHFRNQGTMPTADFSQTMPVPFGSSVADAKIPPRFLMYNTKCRACRCSSILWESLTASKPSSSPVYPRFTPKHTVFRTIRTYESRMSGVIRSFI